ncbi:MAG: YcxB family protein [Anaerovoracaceae bacterium]
MMEKEQNDQFTIEAVMDEQSMREILSGIWTYKTGRNKLPVILYLLAVFAPGVYAFIKKNMDYVLLSAVLGLVGLVCLLIYVGVIALRKARKHERVIDQTIDRYGSHTTLRIDIGDDIRYRFGDSRGSAGYDDIDKIIELEMYLVLELKNGVTLPIWKLGFTKGEWEEFIPYFKERMENR